MLNQPSYGRLLLLTTFFVLVVYLFQYISWLLVPQSSVECNNGLWKHMYKPQRLKVLDKCKEVMGTIKSVKKQKDGNYQIFIRPDAEYEELLNDVNIKKQKSMLVVETVCQNSTCNEIEPLSISSVGSYVWIAGAFVLDTDHDWNAINPVSRMVGEH